MKTRFFVVCVLVFNSLVVAKKENNKIVFAEPGYVLKQKHLQPSKWGVCIEFKIPQSGKIKLTIFNLAKHQQVWQLVIKHMPAGQHNIFWNGTNQIGKKITAGVYFCYLFVDDKKQAAEAIALGP